MVGDVLAVLIGCLLGGVLALTLSTIFKAMVSIGVLLQRLEQRGGEEYFYGNPRVEQTNGVTWRRR